MSMGSDLRGQLVSSGSSGTMVEIAAPADRGRNHGRSAPLCTSRRCVRWPHGAGVASVTLASAESHPASLHRARWSTVPASNPLASATDADLPDSGLLLPAAGVRDLLRRRRTTGTGRRPGAIPSVGSARRSSTGPARGRRSVGDVARHVSLSRGPRSAASLGRGRASKRRHLAGHPCGGAALLPEARPSVCSRAVDTVRRDVSESAPG